MTSVIRIAETDNVWIALRSTEKGQRIQVGESWVTLSEDIAQGHKIAARDISKGENIVKYGVPIGCASCDIEAGHWVHTHNMETRLSGEEAYSYHPEIPQMEQVSGGTFQGFCRCDGKVGIRNEIWIIPTVGCVNDVARRMAQENQDLVTGTIDGLYAFTHPFGCSQTGADHAQTRKLLASLVRHPNAGAVLVLSLGCENLTREQFLEELGVYEKDRVKFLTVQEVEDERKAGRELLRACSRYAAGFHRTPVPVGELVIGMKCGASDGLSGITANPVVGRLSDRMIRRGATTVLTEVPEMFGAENMLLNRCVDEQVFQKAVAMLNGFKDYFLSHGEVVYENPSPGNKAGGITTLEDKSCGCVQKGGHAPIVDVIAYGQQVSARGLNLLDGPGNDLVSSTALTAAGAHIILFTTGRGTPFGAPAPTIKIASNSEIAGKKANWIDLDAGVVAAGESPDYVADQLYRLIIQVAEGRQTRSEQMGYRDISIFKDGVTL